MIIALIVWGFLACFFFGYQYDKYPSERKWNGLAFGIYASLLLMFILNLVWRTFQ